MNQTPPFTLTKVVVVEDDEFLSDAYQIKFSESGFDILMAKDGKTGLDLIRTEKPALIILDLMLPKMNGFDVLLQLQKDKELNKVPVLVASNFADPEHIKTARELGAKDYFIKSDISINDLIEKCRELLK